MTIEEKLVNMLYNHGLFVPQAVEIVERVKADKGHESMAERWHDIADDYPAQLFELLWLSVEDHALQWIDENCPEAWFRPAFEKRATG